MKIPKMTPGQLAKARRLIRNECQNYDKDHNECLMLDEGGGCACVQYISFSLLCTYFRNAILPLDPVLERDLLGGPGTKHCACCNALFVPGSNRAKYCRECAPKVRRRQKTEYQRKVRSTVEQ